MDYIPKRDADLDEWLRIFTAEIPGIATALGLPATFDDDVIAAYAAWQIAYVAHQSAKNAAQSAAETKDEARAAAVEAARSAVARLQAHRLMTDGYRETLGITVPDLVPTPTSPDYVDSLEPPVLLLEPRRGQVIVHFGVNPSNERANPKPDKIAGAKIWCRIGAGAWENVADDTNSPYNHNFDIAEPVNAEYRAQWYDRQGRRGRFSAVVKTAVAP
jgi:hypothetical protein